MKAPLLAAAATGLVLFCGHLPAVAASAAVPADAGPVIADGQAMKAADQAAMPPMRQQIKDQLAKTGYTNVDVMPSSFFVRAKDKAGNPVAMVIGPDSFTTVTEFAPPKTASGATQPPAAPAPKG